MSTPLTVNEVGVNEPEKPPPPPVPPPAPPKPPGPGPEPEPELLMAGILPVILVSVSVRPPAAAATPLSFDTVVTEVEAIEPRPGPRSVSTSMVVPAAGRVRVPVWPRKPNEPAPPEPAVGVLVTVMSVPSPYSERSTLACGFFTPDDTDVTTTHRPVPRA